MATTRVQIGQRIFNYPFTDSLLTSVAYMNPRYDGSKLVSSQKNVYTEGDVSYGKEANIIEKTNTIYEFDWGGGAYPEVEKGGAVHLTKIISLEEYDKDNSDVYLTRPSDNEYNQWDLNLKRTLYAGDEINLEQYTNNVDVLPNRNLVSIEPGLGVPVYSSGYGDVSGSYMVSNTHGVVATYYYLSFGGGIENNQYSNLIFSGNFPLLEIDSNGDYKESTTTHTSTKLLDDIDNNISNGDVYYASFYESLNTPVSGEIKQIGIPLKVVGSGSKIGTVSSWLIFDGRLPEGYSGVGFGEIGSNLGIIIWKARKGDFVTIQPSGDIDNSSYSGLKSGAFYRNFSTDSVKTHFKEITQTFGERPST